MLWSNFHILLREICHCLPSLESFSPRGKSLSLRCQYSRKDNLEVPILIKENITIWTYEVTAKNSNESLVSVVPFSIVSVKRFYPRHVVFGFRFPFFPYLAKTLSKRIKAQRRVTRIKSTPGPKMLKKVLFENWDEHE